MKKIKLFLFVAGLSIALLFNNTQAQINFEWYNNYGKLIHNPSEKSICVDSSGNIYVAAAFSNPDYSNKLKIIKFNPSGVIEWCDSSVNFNLNISCFMQMSYDNYLYVTGTFADSLNKSNVFIVKYGTSGNVLWIRTYHNPENGDDRINSMITDKFGFIYLAGKSDAPGRINDKCLTMKYKYNGDLIWVRRVMNSWGKDITVDDSSYVYVAGNLYNYTWGKHVMMAIKYDSSGNQKWLNSHGLNTIGDDGANVITLDDSNNVIISGYLFYGSDWNYATVKYKPDGTRVWHTTYSHPGIDAATCITTDRNCNIYISGTNENGLAFIKYNPSGLLTATYQPVLEYITNFKFGGGKYLYTSGVAKLSDTSTVRGFYIGKVDTNLNRLFSHTYIADTSDNNVACAFSVDKYGNIYVCGYTIYTILPPPFSEKKLAILKYSQTTGIQKITYEVPSSFSLGQNYPNPFNSVTSIKFSVPLWREVEGRSVSIKVFDLLGREIKILVNEKLKPCTYEVRFDAENLPSGIYFYRMETENFTSTKKLILLK
ncbi:MAG: T9SS type A sorting domain-containing protein [Ignavibacteria bacterium]|nr:T9SS type A sorting domain-containing protein [Ignavibacteria bacterium]